MVYRASIDQLLSLVDHERTGVLRPRPPQPRQKEIFSLERIESLLRGLGNPHLKARTVHVAGTKGKGSTAAFCDSALHAAGFRTGFYSSPHLHSFCERIRLDTKPITEDRFGALVEEIWPHQQRVTNTSGLGPVTLFEFMTAMGFRCFADAHADFQTIEVGLGGRLDATNVVKPAVSVITSISLDHTAILGETLALIAGEKAGIIKPGCPVVAAPQMPEALGAIETACARLNVKPILVGRDVTWKAGQIGSDGQELVVRGRLDEYQLKIPLLGAHQLENAATAVAALEVLREQGHHIPASAVVRGFASVSWPCRMEVLSRDPLVVADGAHNLYSMGALLDSLPKYLSFRRLVLVVGFSRDKSVEDMIGRLAQASPIVIATASRHPRSLGAGDVSSRFASQGIPAAESSTPAEALGKALELAGDDDLILATGSLFVAAEVREAMLGIEPEIYPDLLPASPPKRLGKPHVHVFDI